MRAKPGYISLDGLARTVHHGHSAAGDERAPRDGLDLAGKYFVKIFQKLEIFLPRIGVGVTMLRVVVVL